MHDIEPYYHWRDNYIASEDENSPFFGREYSEFTYSNRIYNYFIHPQWDDFGSPTLYTKILYIDYDEGFAILEFIGEWNDCLQNDGGTLKRNLIDSMESQGITKYVLICENVLNFHGSDNCYYEEWFDDVVEEGGWIAMINTLGHVEDEIRETQIDHYVSVGERFNNINWRAQKPRTLAAYITALIHSSTRELSY